MLIRALFPLRSTEDPGTPPAENPPPPPPVTPPGAPPPAAKIVVAGAKSERELQLERENRELQTKAETEAERAKRVEMEAAELAEENHRLRKLQDAPPRKKAASSWSPIINLD